MLKSHNLLIMLKINRIGCMLPRRTFKNFGHKRQPTPTVTVLWHGFLTFTFLGMAINWKNVANFVFGEDNGTVAPWDGSINVIGDNVSNTKIE